MKDAKEVVIDDLINQLEDGKLTPNEYFAKCDIIEAAEEGHDIHHYNKLLEKGEQ